MKLSFAEPGKLLLALMAAAACGALLPAAAPAAGWEFNSAFNYDTGKYGSAVRTDSVYIPFTLRRKYDSAGFSVTVPYLRQSSTGEVTRVGGNPVRVAKGKGTAAGSSESGPGDILLRGSYTLELDGPGSFDLALAGKVKLPTADRNKGLGTGEMDEGVGLEFAKEVTPALTLLSDAYYTIIGAPAGVNFNNELALEAGVYCPLRKKLALTVLYETRSAIVDGNAAPRSFSGTLSYSISDGFQLAGGLTLGMSDGSPDLAIGAGFSGRF